MNRRAPLPLLHPRRPRSPCLPPAVIAKPTVPPRSTAPSACFRSRIRQSLRHPATGRTSPAPPVAPPQFRTLDARQPSARETAKRVLNMEEVLGTDWLNKLGMIILVIGVALFLAYEMRELGPAGKVLVGFVVSGGFLGAGVFFERRERWRILARAGMGGGWALLYFTTYAMNHVAAGARPAIGILGFRFAADRGRGDGGAHAALQLPGGHRPRLPAGFLHHQHQPRRPTSLIASAILAVALVVIVGKRRWFDLEVLAIVGRLLESLLLAAAHHRTHGRASPSLSGVHSERRAADLLLAGVSRSYLLRRIPAPLDLAAFDAEPQGEEKFPPSPRCSIPSCFSP